MTYQHLLPGGDDPFGGRRRHRRRILDHDRVSVRRHLRGRAGRLGWKIWRRTVVHEWTKVEDSAGYVALDPEWPQFRRDRTDPVYSSLDGLSA